MDILIKQSKLFGNSIFFNHIIYLSSTRHFLMYWSQFKFHFNLRYLFNARCVKERQNFNCCHIFSEQTCDKWFHRTFFRVSVFETGMRSCKIRVWMRHRAVWLMGKRLSIFIDSKIKQTPRTAWSMGRKRRTPGSMLLFCDVKKYIKITIGSAYNTKPMWNHCKPRPQVAYCWRNIDYVNVSLWIQALGAARCALFLSLLFFF